MSADLLQPRRVLVTGAAGFIGYHLCERLLDDGVQVLGVDSLTPYYDPRLKADRLARLSARVGHLVYASSSSVYGAGNTMPLSEDKVTDRPVSLYEASKKANEVMAYSYSHLYDLPATGLRLFTVYGPWGRPDMAIFRFVRAIEEGAPIDVYNHGQMRRDFTYVGDVVEAIVRVMHRPPQREGAAPPQRILNVGNSSPVMLMDFIACLERALGKVADKRLLPMQPGDVPDTWADVTRLGELTGFSPATPIREGVQRFVDWYRAYVRERGEPPAAS